MASLHAAARAGEKVGDVEVNVQPLPSKDNRSGTAYGTRHGYVEFRVQLKNRSTEDHIVHLSYPGTRDGWVQPRRGGYPHGSHRGRTRGFGFALPAARGSRQRDAGSARGGSAEDGKLIPVASLHGMVRSLRQLRAGLPSCSAGAFRKIFATARIARKPRNRGRPRRPDAEERSRRRRNAGNRPLRVSPQRAAREPMESQLAGLFLLRRHRVDREGGGGNASPGAVGRAAIPGVRRHAVDSWAEVPAVFSQGGVADGKGGYWVGLGHAVASLDGGKADWDATYKKLLGTPIHVYQPVEKPGNLYDLLVAEATVPVRGLFVLVLLFGVGIGPANLWLLSRYKRRIWLWWNVPAISLLTCLAVFGYSLASEGLTGHGKTASMTLLDERCHRATTIGYLSYYCPLTPSVGPRFGVDTDVALLDNQPSRGGDTTAGDRRRSAVCGLDQRSAPDFRLGQRPSAGLFPVPQERRPPRAADRREEGGRVAENRQRLGGGHPAAVPGRRLGARVRGPRHSGRRGTNACDHGRDGQQRA